jgi:hypothetical protein
VIASPADTPRKLLSDDAATQNRQSKAPTSRAASDLLDELVSLVETHGTLYDWAAQQPQPRALKGRAPGVRRRASRADEKRSSYVMRGTADVRTITGDRFWRPSRAPIEMERSTRLIAAGIPTSGGAGDLRVTTPDSTMPRRRRDALRAECIRPWRGPRRLAPDCPRDEALSCNTCTARATWRKPG